jgi:flagellum-specific peptidoglycan hydrolase FlgJ
MDLLSKNIIEQVRRKIESRTGEDIAEQTRKGVMSKKGVTDSTATVDKMQNAMLDVVAKTIEARTPKDEETPSLDYYQEQDIDSTEDATEAQAKRIQDSAITTFKAPDDAGLMSKPDADGVQPMGGKATHSGSFDNKEDYLKAIIPAAKEAAEKTGLDWKLIVAQSAIETGWGSKVKGNSFFGIKGHGAEDTVSFTTQEEVDGKRVTIKDAFRSYDSLEDSVAGYAQFLLDNPRYKDYLAADTLEDATKALQASGYATDSEYGKKVLQTAKGRTLNNFLKNNPEFN